MMERHFRGLLSLQAPVALYIVYYSNSPDIVYYSSTVVGLQIGGRVTVGDGNM